MGLLYDRIRGTCDDQGGTVACKIIVEAFNMALMGLADGIFTKQKLIDAFRLTPEEVGPGDGTYLTLSDMAIWYQASSNKMKFIFVAGQIFRHLECVHDDELAELDATDQQVCAYMKTL